MSKRPSSTGGRPAGRPFSFGRAEAGLIALAVLSGALFFSSLGTLWPLAPADLGADRTELVDSARAGLESLGFDLTGYRAAARLSVRRDALDHLERALGRAGAEDALRDGRPAVRHVVTFKRRDSPETFVAELNPRRPTSHAGNRELFGWRKHVDEDYAAPDRGVDAARRLAERALAERSSRPDSGIGPVDDYEVRGSSSARRGGHTLHAFEWERLTGDEPPQRVLVVITVAGDELLGFERRLIVPGESRRAARADAAVGVALESVGFALLAAGCVLAFVVCLVGLRDGAVELGRAARWPLVVFGCLLAVSALDTATLFATWDPLWPRWVSALRSLVLDAIGQAWLLVVLLAVVAAGDAVDRDAPRSRGASLHALARGRLLDPGVVRASARGFPIGLLCGGVLAGSVLGLQAVLGAPTSLQPRGFFFFVLNSAWPAATSILFFLGVALAEELGYRYFAGGWLLQRTGRRWVAVALPAAIYGLTHTRLEFLPPASPEWGRALVLTAVGAVWGWAFVRYDALTVVLSHFTADLFIFNWPRFAEGDLATRASVAATIAVPLLPAVAAALATLVPRPTGPEPARGDEPEPPLP